MPTGSLSISKLTNRYNRAVRIAFNVKHAPIVAYNAGVCVSAGHIRGRLPLRVLHFMEPGLQGRLDSFLVPAAAKRLDEIPERFSRDDSQSSMPYIQL
jgi:hypothetical protein